MTRPGARPTSVCNDNSNSNKDCAHSRLQSTQLAKNEWQQLTLSPHKQTWPQLRRASLGHKQNHNTRSPTEQSTPIQSDTQDTTNPQRHNACERTPLSRERASPPSQPFTHQHETLANTGEPRAWHNHVLPPWRIIHHPQPAPLAHLWRDAIETTWAETQNALDEDKITSKQAVLRRQPATAQTLQHARTMRHKTRRDTPASGRTRRSPQLASLSLESLSFCTGVQSNLHRGRTSPRLTQQYFGGR